jgi:hypothetical protein
MTSCSLDGGNGSAYFWSFYCSDCTWNGSTTPAWISNPGDVGSYCSDETSPKCGNAYYDECVNDLRRPQVCRDHRCDSWANVKP